MKPFYTLILFLCFFSVERAHSQYWSDWSVWTTTDCFQNVQFRLRSTIRGANKVEATIQFRNDYGKDIFFNYQIKTDAYTYKAPRLHLEKREVVTVKPEVFFPSDLFSVYIEKLRLNNDDVKIYKKCYD